LPVRRYFLLVRWHFLLVRCLRLLVSCHFLLVRCLRLHARWHFLHVRCLRLLVRCFRWPVRHLRLHARWGLYNRPLPLPVRFVIASCSLGDLPDLCGGRGLGRGRQMGLYNRLYRPEICLQFLFIIL
jgi:hypothetical protein